MTIYADLAEPPTVKRDRWGRPIIEGKPWQRMTTFASLIADKAGLIPWAQEMTAAGLAQRPDLLATVAANLDNKTEIRKAAEAAKEHGGGSAAATLGTEGNTPGRLESAGTPMAPTIAPGAMKKPTRSSLLDGSCGYSTTSKPRARSTMGESV